MERGKFVAYSQPARGPRSPTDTATDPCESTLGARWVLRQDSVVSRPADANSAETYDRILAAALAELMETTPRTGISVRRVAERAGVSLGTLQYYFENKQKLLEACLDGYYARLGALAGQLVDHFLQENTAAGAETIAFATRRLYRFVRDERPLIELRLITNAMRGELAPERQREFMGQLIERAARVLEPHVAIDQLDARLSIQMLVAGIIRMALLSPSERLVLTGSETEEVVEDFVVRAALRLIRPTDA